MQLSFLAGSVRIVVVMTATLIPTATAEAAPRTLPGWPVAAPAGSVHQGPGGGPLVVGTDVLEFQDVVVAFERNGRQRWVLSRKWPCGNCEPRTRHVERLQPDLTYGPIGPESGSVFAVDRAGRRVLGCDGVVEPDGTCISAALGGGLSARRGPVTVWSYAEPNFVGTTPDGRDPLVVRDGGSTVYTSYSSGWVGAGAPGTSGPTAPGRLIAVNASTGAFRWRQLGMMALAGTWSGVIATDGHNLIAFDADGVERWRAPVTGEVAVDAGRRRVYVTTTTTNPYAVHPRSRVLAFDGEIGRRLWATPLADDARLLDLAPSGQILIATGRDRYAAVHGYRVDGRVVWRYPVAITPVLERAAWSSGVVGATVLRDGTVAAALNGPVDSILVRFDPRTAAPRAPTRPRFALSRSRIPSDRVRVPCGVRRCDFLAGSVTLTMRLPRAVRLTIVVRNASGKRAPNTAPIVIDAPAGTSFARLFELGGLRPGRHGLEIRWREPSGQRRQTLPLTVV